MIDKVRLVHDWLVAAAPTAAKIGCSPSAVVAQAVLETSWGAAAIGNNIFGIKADASWKGKRQRVLTREVINGESVMMYDDFRDYDTIAESFADHFAFLERNSRYRAAGVFDPDNTKSDRQYFEALQRAGYATDPNYADSLLAVQHSVEALAGIAPQPRSVLMIGDSGPDVTALQSALVQHGAKLLIDGQFGPATRKAVTVFQVERGLSIDGIAGPQTRKALSVGR